MRIPFARLSRARTPAHERLTDRVSEERLDPEVDVTNVAGRRVVGPSQGFGQLWRKRFWVVLDPGYPPTDIVHEWKRDFSAFWPGESELKGRIEEQAVTGADLQMPAGTKIETGLVVIRSEPQAFTLMTLQGHIFAGWVRFSASENGERTRVEIEVRMRAGDPVYEVGLLLGGHETEERFWKETLAELAARFGQQPQVQMSTQLEDRGRRWSRITNIWYNAAIRTQLHRVWRWFLSLPGRARR